MVKAFSVESLNSMWIAEDSLASDLVFTPNGQFIVESNVFAPYFYWRSREYGEVVRQGAIKNPNQIGPGDCNGGGQIILANVRNNTALIADYNNLIGLNTNNIVVVRQLDFESGKCKNLFNYQGAFDLFDLNPNGTLLVYGGEGKDDSAVIWDVEKQAEVCRIFQVEFGRFIPGENILAIIREQKLAFVNPSTCQEVRELNIAPSLDYENYLAFSPDGKLFAVAKDSIRIMKVATGETLAQIPFPKNGVPNSSKLFLSGIKFSPNGRYLVIAYYLLDGANYGEVQLWQLQ